MARPVGANAANTKARLVVAARDHFTRRGVEATSLRQVASDAGVSLATIHHYYGTKAALYGACLDSVHAELSDELSPVVELLDTMTRRVGQTSPDPAALSGAVGELVRAGFAFVRGHRSALRLLMRPLIAEGELDTRWRDQALTPFLDRTSRLLGPVTGRPVSELRLGLLTLTGLAVRWALSSPEELALLAGLDSSDPDATWQTFDDHLVRLAHTLLLVPATIAEAS